jgi:hypothetical protein
VGECLSPPSTGPGGPEQRHVRVVVQRGYEERHLPSTSGLSRNGLDTTLVDGWLSDPYHPLAAFQVGQGTPTRVEG